MTPQIACIGLSLHGLVDQSGGPIGVAKFFAISPAEGAETIAYLASSSDVATTTGQVSPDYAASQARDDRSAWLLWQRSAVLTGMKEKWCAAALTPWGSSRPHFQPDADLPGIIFGEMNAGLLKSFLYFDDSRELSFLNAFVSFNALQGRQA